MADATAKIAQDDGVREVFGVAKNDGDVLVTVCEHGAWIRLDASRYSGDSRYLTVPAARRLARQLHRLARRIERREPAA